MHRFIQIFTFLGIILCFNQISKAYAQEQDLPAPTVAIKQDTKRLQVSVTEDQAVFHYTVIYHFEGEKKTAEGVVNYGRLRQTAEDMRSLLLDSLPKVSE